MTSEWLIFQAVLSIARGVVGTIQIPPVVFRVEGLRPDASSEVSVVLTRPPRATWCSIPPTVVPERDFNNIASSFLGTHIYPPPSLHDDGHRPTHIDWYTAKKTNEYSRVSPTAINITYILQRSNDIWLLLYFTISAVSHYAEMVNVSRSVTKTLHNALRPSSCSQTFPPYTSRK